MKGKRIKIGFRRIGIVLAVPFMLSAVIAGGVFLHAWMTASPPGTMVYGLGDEKYFFPLGVPREEMARVISEKIGTKISVGPEPWSYHPVAVPAGSVGDGPFVWAAVSLVLGVLAYAASWALGWIVSGFVGENDAIK